MQIIQGTTAFEIEGRSAVAIGKFDGIHEGHRLLLSHILKGRENGRRAVVFTFDPPASVFFGKSGEGQLTTKKEKRQIFAELGIDVLVEFPLTAETAAISPEKFIEEIEEISPVRKKFYQEILWFRYREMIEKPYRRLTGKQ